jgi:hypothetical protein
VSDRDEQREGSQWNVDGEQPWPVGHQQDGGGQGRPDAGGAGHDQAVDPDAAPEPMARVDKPDQRRVDAHDAGAADSLQDPRRDQRRQRICGGAGERCRGEHQQTRAIYPTIADDVAQRGERQQRDRDRELVGVHDPDGIRGAGAHIAGDGGKAILMMLLSRTAMMTARATASSAQYR